MVLRAALLALAIGSLPASAEPATATDAIPDEPGAFVLPVAPILQAVAADLDGDGSRELVRLVLRAGLAPFAEVWGLDAGRWRLIGEAVEVVPGNPGGPRGVQAPEAEPAEAVALRLIVHRVGEREHVVVASQPRFDELEANYRLELHDLVIEAGVVRRVPVAQPADPVDGILAIDLDGDGTDELLTARSLAPLGGISFRTDARVLRWTDGAFGTPTRSELPIGSGDTPFILGDSDGRPGDEAAIISTLGAPGLYRIALGPADTLSVEEFGAVVSAARAVPLPGGSGIAVVARGQVSVHRWPALGPPAPAEASVTIPGAELIGVVDMAKTRLLVHEPENHSLHLLALPALTAIEGGRLIESLATRTLSEVSVGSYVGPLPGGGPHGAEAVIFAGSYLPSPPGATFLSPFPSATFAWAEPVGLVGDRDWMAILHAARGTPLAAPGGGRFVPLEPRLDAWLSVVPLASVLLPAKDGGVLEPPLSGAVPIVDGLLAGPNGFVAEIRAPAGSRVHVLGLDASAPGWRFTVPVGGRLEVPVSLPDADVPNPLFRADGLVLTPAGHAYVARWDIQVLTEPPPLEVGVATHFGSSEVLVSGRTSTYASVLVDGQPAALSDVGGFSGRVSLPPWPTDVEVVATDFVGNSSRTVVSGVGILDYRALPWVPIVALLVAGAGATLFLRVPRPAGERPRMDDAVLEEIDSG